MSKPKETQEFLFASISYEIEKELEEAKSIKRALKGG